MVAAEALPSVVEARKELQTLLARYEKHKHDPAVIGNEKQAGQSLIVPLIRDLLHWDVDDPSEFGTEESQMRKRIDYVVRHQGITQFIVEAKAPSKDIFGNADFYKQAHTYGYNKSRDFAVLTNFRQLVILACRKPYKNTPEETEIGRMDLATASDEDLRLLLCFEKDYWLSQGRNNALYARLGQYKPLAPLDKRLLEDMSHWREMLLTNIQKNGRNRGWDFSDEREFMHLEEEVQKFIDRLIFICFCEDKELNDSKLKNGLDEKRERYSGKAGWLLERVRAQFAEYRRTYDSDIFDKSACDDLHVDDDKLADLIQDLREPRERLPYDFKSIEEDILGRVYETFIGHLTTGQKRFKEKEDIGKRKREGIYYTPKYIVDYIVNSTVREYIKGKSFAEISKVRILDPACGSGSFLRRAFDILVEESQRQLKRPLTYEEKKELMLNCIHGVDLDERAVAVAKLNLAFKLAEHGQRLPAFEGNIRLGNSLIDDPTVDPKKFVWKEEFPHIMANGGFDVVIGNPPWGAGLSKTDKQWFRENYRSGKGIIDTFALFVERAGSLLRGGGFLGLVLPDIVLLKNYQIIRKYILDNFTIASIAYNGMAFKGVNLNSVTLVLKNERPKKSHQIEININREETRLKHNRLPQSLFETIEDYKFNIYLTPDLIALKNKLNSKFVPMAFVGDAHEGIHSGNIRDKLFVEKRLNSKCRPLIFGRDEVGRYFLEWAGKWVHYDRSIVDKRKGEYAGLAKEEYFTNPKVFIRRTGDVIYAIPDSEGYFASNNLFVFSLKSDYIEKLDLRYITGLLNSKLMTFFYRLIQPREKQLFAELKITHISKFPIAIVDRNQQAAIIERVDRMIDRQKRLRRLKGKSEEEARSLRREIEKTDREIDELVYEIYGLTAEERRIVEEAVQAPS
jgi:type I restriction-modification system DNA methylase subunit